MKIKIIHILVFVFFLSLSARSQNIDTCKSYYDTFLLQNVCYTKYQIPKFYKGSHYIIDMLREELAGFEVMDLPDKIYVDLVISKEGKVLDAKIFSRRENECNEIENIIITFFRRIEGKWEYNSCNMQCSAYRFIFPIVF